MCRPAWARALADAQRLRDLAALRRARDQVDRANAQPLAVEALAGVGPSGAGPEGVGRDGPVSA